MMDVLLEYSIFKMIFDVNKKFEGGGVLQPPKHPPLTVGIKRDISTHFQQLSLSLGMLEVYPVWV